MKKYSLIFIVIVLLIICFVYYFRSSASNQSSELPLVYSNYVYNFSINYPLGLSTSTFSTPDGNGTVVLIANMKTGVGFQIYITPYSGSSVITPDILKQNISTLNIVDPKPISINGSDEGLSFVDGTSSTANRQIWFTKDSYLYQLTAPKSFDIQLSSIIKTWHFIKTHE